MMCFLSLPSGFVFLCTKFIRWCPLTNLLRKVQYHAWLYNSPPISIGGRTLPHNLRARIGELFMVLSFIIRGTGKGRRAGWSLSWWGCASGDGKILRCAQDDSCPFLEQVRRV